MHSLVDGAMRSLISDSRTGIANSMPTVSCLLFGRDFYSYYNFYRTDQSCILIQQCISIFTRDRILANEPECIIFHVIYQKRVRVLHRGIQTPRNRCFEVTGYPNEARVFGFAS